MVLIVPVEEQTKESGEEEVKATEPRMPDPEAVSERKTQRTKSNEPLQPKNIAEDNPPGREEVKGKLAQKVKHKKINPRKKANPYNSRQGPREKRGSEGCRSNCETKKREAKKGPTPRIHARGVFRTLGGECARTLGVGTPLLGWGGGRPPNNRQ
jgi:hypothetical protein